MKFCPHHFPVGTIFRLNDEIMRFTTSLEPKQRREWPVAGIVRNGVDSYVLKTGIMEPWAHGGGEHEVSYNISHVEAVVKRGDGPVKIDHSWFGSNQNAKLRKSLKEDCDLMRLNEPIKSWKPRRGFHNTGSPRAVIMLEVMKVAPEGAMIDYNRLIRTVLDQTWASNRSYLMPYLHLSVINKKRLRRFLRQNLNRFILAMKPMLKQEQEEARLDYERMMESDLDREHDALDKVFGERKPWEIWYDDGTPERERVTGFDTKEEAEAFLAASPEENGLDEQGIHDGKYTIEEGPPATEDLVEDEEPPFDTEETFTVEEKNRLPENLVNKEL